MLLNFPLYMKNNIEENEYSLLEELGAKQFYKPKGRSQQVFMMTDKMYL